MPLFRFLLHSPLLIHGYSRLDAAFLRIYSHLVDNERELAEIDVAYRATSNLRARTASPHIFLSSVRRSQSAHLPEMRIPGAGIDDT